MKSWLNWLLLFVPLALVFRYLWPVSGTLTFAASGLAIVPLAGWLGKATDQLAHKTSESIGGLLNATFGNAAELIIGLMALRSGLYAVVKASLTGSIIGNILLVMGASILAGGARHKIQHFNPRGARVQATMLILSAIALIVPAVYHHLTAPGFASEQAVSTAIAFLLLVTYALSLLFSLHTHKQFFAPPGELGEREAAPGSQWSVVRSLGVLAGATALIAWLSEILVGSVEAAAHSLGMTDLFVGVVVIAIIGNAAEHFTAVTMAFENRMELSLGIAVSSSIQIALFAAPLLVLLSHVIAPRPLDLVFTPAEVLAVAVAVIIMAQIAGDGESNWLEGVQLIAVYLILAVAFYFLPESASAEAVRR